MAFRWRTDDGPTLNAGFVAVIFQGILISIAKKPYILGIFQGGGSGPPAPSLWIRTCICSTSGDQDDDIDRELLTAPPRQGDFVDYGVLKLHYIKMQNEMW